MSSSNEQISVFGADYASVYDSLYQEKDYARECSIFETATGLQGRSARLLDVGCGTGGHCFELTRRGHIVTGVDMSHEMIRIARSKATAEGFQPARPDFIQGTAGDFSVPGQPFDAAMMMFAVLGYLRSNTDVLRALTNIGRHLKNGGLFVCDFWWGPAVLTQRPGERVRIFEGPAGKTVRATRTTLDTTANSAHVHFDLLRAEKAGQLAHASETHIMRYFFGPELELLFQQAGFELLSISQFPDTDLRPDDKSWNAMAIARKIDKAKT